MRAQSSLLLILAILPFYPSLAFRCKTIPSDPAWPSDTLWAVFNASVDGRLIKSVPLATPCHNPNFDAAQCTVVQNNWHLTDFHEASSSSIMSATFANRSCDPFNGADSSCILGTYVAYAVNVSTTAHIANTLAFAKIHNIRFVVRNTGHDYMGKSTGNGALAIWMHYLVDTEWMPSFSSPGYTGPAVKAHSGITAAHLYQQASEHGYTIMGGACPTVGLTGGFLQGGGHGPLSSLYGLAADNILAFEVVTTQGAFVTASPTSNTDLFWALRGGGPGTYGIVWTVTMKAHADVPFTTAVVIFSTNPTVTFDTWVQGVEAFRSLAPSITDAGGYALSIYAGGYFQLSPLIIQKKSVADVAAMLQPLFANLTALGIPFTQTITAFPGFFQAYSGAFNTSIFMVQNSQNGGRLIPSAVWATPAALAAYNAAVKGILTDGAGFLDLAVAPTLAAGGNPVDAVLPAWRSAQVQQSVFLFWDDAGTQAAALAQRQKITGTYMPALKAATPGSGSYMNEADPFDPDWKTAFYGTNYAALLAVKDTWDPDQLLYGTTAVGGDRWTQAPDGRLCPA